MARYLRLVEDDPEHAADEWLHNASDDVLACRGQGHSWPKIRPGKLKKGVRAYPRRDGCYELVVTCNDCGMERRLVTLPDHSVNFVGAIYSYRAPEGYRAPRGVPISRRQCFGETMRRINDELHTVSEASGA